MEFFEFVRAAENLESKIGSFVALLSEAGDPFCSSVPAPFLKDLDALSLIRKGYRDIYYHDDTLDGRFTPVYIGAIGVDPACFESAISVNLAKDAFRAECSRMESTLRVRDSRPLSRSGAAKHMRSLLREAGYGKLSLKQAYRHIPIVQQTPKSVRFSYVSKGKSISKISVEEALALLESADFESASADIDRRSLMALPADRELARVQDQAGHYKINLTFSSEIVVDFVLPSQVYLPIVYPIAKGLPPKRQDELPAPNLDFESPRKIRSDRKLCDEPIAPSIRVYDYLAD